MAKKNMREARRLGVLAAMAAMAGLRAGRTQRRIAADLWGEEAAAREWGADSWMRSRVRRRVAKARALDADGWREFLP